MIVYRSNGICNVMMLHTIKVEINPNDMACELGIPWSVGLLEISSGVPDVVVDDDEEDWYNSAGRVCWMSFFNTFDNIPFMIAPIKNDIICVFRLYASTIKNKPDTNSVVDEPMALIDMLPYFVMVAVNGDDATNDNMVVDAVSFVVAMIFSSYKLLAVLE